MKLASNLEMKALDYANQGNSFIGIRSSGKSWGATKAAEELMDADIPIVAIDPIGVWPYLKSGINGNKGYPVVVIGGQQADLPLSEDTIEDMVKAALKGRISIVIDLKGISTSNKSIWTRIVVKVVETLMELNDLYGPRHVFIEEAAEFVPQKLNPGLNLVYSRIESMARMGRNVGLGYTLINQRAEEISKAIFELSEQVFVFRQAGKNSLKSIKDWLDYRGLKDKEITQTLPKMPTGHCWVINQEVEIQCHILPKKTFHPDPKERTQKLPTNTIKADPSAFIAEIQQMLKDMEAEEKQEPDTKEKGNSKKTSAIIEDLRSTIAALQEKNNVLTNRLKFYTESIVDAHNYIGRFAPMAAKELQEFNELENYPVIIQEPGSPKISNVQIRVGKDKTAMITADVDLDQQESVNADWDIDKGVEFAKKEQDIDRSNIRTVTRVNHTEKDNAGMRMLRAAAMFPKGITKSRMCIIAGIKSGGSTYRNGASFLRTNNYVTDDGEVFFITPQGKLAAGPVEKIKDMVGFWLEKVGSTSAAGRLLRNLDKVYPNTYTHEQLARLANIEAKGSTWRNAASVLRKNKLIEEPRKGTFKLSNEMKA